MSNVNSARPVVVGTIVESLESRTLLVATPGPSFSAVVSYIQSTAASQLRLTQHADVSFASLTAAKQSVANATAEGKTLLAADKAAVKAAAGDPAALDVAKQKLAADKVQVRASILAAKANVKSLQGQAKADGAALKGAVKQSRAALARELSDSDANARKAVDKLLTDWQSIQVGSNLTPDELQALADDLKAAADGATQPSAESVATLRTNALLAIADGDLSDAEADSLLGDLKGVFLSADISETESDKIVHDVAVIVDKISLSPDEVTMIAGDVQQALRAFNGG